MIKSTQKENKLVWPFKQDERLETSQKKDSIRTKKEKQEETGPEKNGHVILKKI